MKIKNGILGNRQFGYLETSSVSKFHEVERVSRNYTFLRRAVDHGTSVRDRRNF